MLVLSITFGLVWSLQCSAYVFGWILPGLPKFQSYSSASTSLKLWYWSMIVFLSCSAWLVTSLTSSCSALFSIETLSFCLLSIWKSYSKSWCAVSMLFLSWLTWSIYSSDVLSLYSYVWYDCSYTRIFSSSASIRSISVSSSIFCS